MSSRESQLAEIVAAWRSHLEAGDPVDPDEVIAAHPDLAEELREHFDALSRMGRARRSGREARTLRTLPVDRYHEFKPVGEGGMGIVYWAIDTDLNREVAFKIIRTGAEGTPAPARPIDARTPEKDTPASRSFETLKQRFLQEAWITSGMTHPGIVPVYELGQTDDGIPYYTMRFIKGETTLASEIEATRNKDIEERLALLEPFLKICDAVRYAHARGVIHRDLKPENIALGEFGETVVLDWGLAAMQGADEADVDRLAAHLKAFREATDLKTLAGAMGTPGYMSPEAALGQSKAVDAQSDVYSLGAILFQILTGRIPHEFKTFAELATKLLHEGPPSAAKVDASVPDALSDLCTACLSRDKDARPSSADSLANAIRTWQVERERQREVEGFLREVQATLEAAETMHGAAMVQQVDRAAATVARVLERRPESLRALDYRGRAEELRERGIRERERMARRRTLVRSAVTALLTLVVGAVVAIMLVDAARREEATQRARADKQLRRARALGLANASALAASTDPELALLLAREAGRAQLLPEVVTQLHSAILGQHDRIEFRGHEKRVKTLALSPDGDQLLSGAEDGTARVWDIEGRTLLVLEHEWPVVAAEFSRDGETILTTSRDTRFNIKMPAGAVVLWSRDGKELWRIEGHQPAARRAMFSPTGKHILTLGADHTARLWDLDGRPLAAFEGHEHQWVVAAFSPAGDRIVTASWESARDIEQAPTTVRLWTLDGQVAKVLGEHAGGIRCVRWSPDGDRILSCSYDKGARLWDGEGNEVARFGDYPNPLDQGLFSPTGEHVVVGDWEVLRIWDRDGNLVATLRGHDTAQGLSMAFSPSGDRLVTATLDQTVRVWGMDGTLLTSLKQPDVPADRVLFAASGQAVFTAASAIRLWDLAAKEVAVMRMEGEPWGAVYSPDGSHILTASIAKTVQAHVWTAEGRHLKTVEWPEKPNGLGMAWSPSGDKFVTHAGNKVARMWDLQGRPLAALRHTLDIWEPRFSPKGDHVLARVVDWSASPFERKHDWCLWDLQGKRVGFASGQKRPLKVAVFAPAGDEVLVAGHEEHAARLYGLDDSERLALPLGGPCVSGHFSPAGNCIVTTETKQGLAPLKHARVRVWDRQGRQLSTWETRGAWVTTLSPSGTMLLGKTADHRSLVLWDLEGKELATMRGHGNTIWGNGFSPAGDRIVSASMDRTARIWDLEGNQLAVLRGHKNFIVTAEFNSAGDRVVTSSVDGTARVWLARPAELLDLAGKRVTREFTAAERARYADLLGDLAAGG